MHGRVRMTWMSGLAVALIAASTWGQATTQPTVTTKPAVEVAFPYDGVVTGDNVYVRSGSDRNYYAVTKLNRGDRVTVVSERYGWVEILSPTGTFSIVDKEYVEAGEGDVGVIKAMTWAHAGSSLNDRHYAKQVRLGAGEKVKLIGETTDQSCFKIVPPEGATLWMSGDYVKPDDGTMTPRATAGTREVTPIRPGDLVTRSPGPTTPRKVATTTAPFNPDEPEGNQYSEAIKTFEEQIKSEWSKPAITRDFQPIIETLRVLEQEGDATEQRYAKYRIAHLQKQVELKALLIKMGQLQEETTVSVEEIRRRREQIRVQGVRLPDDIVVRGQIIASNIYDGSGMTPKRWRIIDPNAPTRKTLAYIELAPGSTIDPSQYTGQYVGIKASAHKIPPGTIPPVSVYTVSSIEALAVPGTQPAS